eukprot:15053491-Ditylum_brightwellii.AAC.1
MAILAKEESSNQEFSSALSSSPLTLRPNTAAPPAQPVVQACICNAYYLPQTQLYIKDEMRYECFA